MVEDTRSWFQRFFDQTMMGDYYKVYLTSDGAGVALSGLDSLPKKDWRTKGLLSQLSYGLEHPVVVGGNEIIVLDRVGTSDILRLKGFIEIKKENVRKCSML